MYFIARVMVRVVKTSHDSIHTIYHKPCAFDNRLFVCSLPVIILIRVQGSLHTVIYEFYQHFENIKVHVIQRGILHTSTLQQLKLLANFRQLGLDYKCSPYKQLQMNNN